MTNGKANYFYCSGKFHTSVARDGARSVFRHQYEALAVLSNGVGLLAADSQGSVLREGVGQALSYTSYGQSSGVVEQRTLLGYTGQFVDAATGGYPLGNGRRLYMPGIGRFCSPDSLSPFGAGGLNAYAYCSGDPVNRVDPSGRSPSGPLWGYKPKNALWDNRLVKSLAEGRGSRETHDVHIPTLTKGGKDFVNKSSSSSLSASVNSNHDHEGKITPGPSRSPHSADCYPCRRSELIFDHSAKKSLSWIEDSGRGEPVAMGVLSEHYEEMVEVYKHSQNGGEGDLGYGAIFRERVLWSKEKRIMRAQFFSKPKGHDSKVADLRKNFEP
ncbi:RHS repeat-associated core domain-containing protein [Pseudomonas monteilii]|nr:RHS repeat-associated core domain-containing protein [Pseudomonas monteilii]